MTFRRFDCNDRLGRGSPGAAQRPLCLFQHSRSARCFGRSRTGDSGYWHAALAARAALTCSAVAVPATYWSTVVLMLAAQRMMRSCSSAR